MNENTLIESRMLDLGADRYIRQQESAAARGELRSAENRLFKGALGKVEAAMQEYLDTPTGRGRPETWKAYLADLGATKAALISLRLAFAGVSSSKGYVDTCIAIGRQVEVELIGAAVSSQNEEAYKTLLRRVKGLRTVDFRGKVFTELAQEAGFWSPMDVQDHIKIGAGFLNFCLEHSGVFETVLENEGTEDQDRVLAFTEDAAVLLDDIGEMEQWMRPVFLPMLSKPRDWESFTTGCYEDPRLAATVPMVRTVWKGFNKKINEAVQAGAEFAQALNATQSVPLQANAFVAQWVEKAHAADMTISGFPEAVIVVPKDADKRTKALLRKTNKERSALRKELVSTIGLAKQYVDFGTFYLPSVLDWRGRVYAKPHLNHQREDHCKALFQFANGRTLTPMGAMWLRIHVANCAAFKVDWEGGKKALDKLPLDVRGAWTVENYDRIERMVDDPAADLWWTEADSPFMFLAACEALVGYTRNPEGYLCHIPVGVDGSCSGLQHFSAMLRDPVGGAHVNLVPQDAPADVYAAVAAAVAPLVEKDAAEGHEMAARWLKIGITRKIAKRCVMTYVYGSKQYGFSEHLAEDFSKDIRDVVTPDMVQSEGEEDWQFSFRIEKEIKATAAYLAKHIWAAVQSTVKAAAEGMDWLQETASLLAREGIAATWTTPSGFPVSNSYYEHEYERVNLLLWESGFTVPKRTQARVMTGHSKKLNTRKCRSSISPNFVHSLDAAHLHKVVLKATAEGIEDVLLIHDSFSCHPNDMPRFVQIVRETFVEMYQQHDPIGDLYEFARTVLSAKGLKELKQPPQRGTLDLDQVLGSHYAFA